MTTKKLMFCAAYREFRNGFLDFLDFLSMYIMNREEEGSERPAHRKKFLHLL
jgi:hypothetical protein